MGVMLFLLDLDYYLCENLIMICEVVDKFLYYVDKLLKCFQCIGQIYYSYIMFECQVGFCDMVNVMVGDIVVVEGDSVEDMCKVLMDFIVQCIVVSDGNFWKGYVSMVLAECIIQGW